MKSLKKMPCELIEMICRNFCDGLWEHAKLVEQNDCRELAASISNFQDDLRNEIIQHLFVSSIVEEE